MFGVLKAVERFDPERGVAFPAFAMPTVMGELRRHFRDHTWSLRVPRRLKELHVSVGRAVEELRGALGRQPTVDELARQLHVTAEEILLAADRACFVAKRTGVGLIATADEGLAIARDFAFKEPTPIDAADPSRTGPDRGAGHDVGPTSPGASGGPKPGASGRQASSVAVMALGVISGAVRVATGFGPSPNRIGNAVPSGVRAVDASVRVFTVAPTVIAAGTWPGVSIVPGP